MVKIYNDATTTYSQAGELYSVARIIYNDAGVTYSSSLYSYNGVLQANIFTRALSDTEGLTDSTSRWISVTTFVNLTDTEGMTDSLDYASAVSRILADNVGATDNVNKEVCWGRTITDAEGITDNLTRAFQIFINLSDSEGVTDNLSVFLPFIEKTIVKMLELREIKPQMGDIEMTIKLGAIDNVIPKMGQIT